jgi:hypothetical protein
MDLSGVLPHIATIQQVVKLPRDFMETKKPYDGIYETCKGPCEAIEQKRFLKHGLCWECTCEGLKRGIKFESLLGPVASSPENK